MASLRIAGLRSWVGWAALMLLALWPPPAPGETPEPEIMRLEMTPERVCFLHQSGHFEVPYKVRAGDTLRSVSERMFGSASFVESIAKNNRLPPGQALAPDSILNIPSREFCLRFSPGYVDSQYEAVRRFVATGPGGAKYKPSWQGRLNDWQGTVKIEELFSRVFVPRTFSAIDLADESRKITFSFRADCWVETFGGAVVIEQIVAQAPIAGPEHRVREVRSNAVRRHRTEFLAEFEELEKQQDHAAAARLVEDEAPLVLEAIVPMLIELVHFRFEPGKQSLAAERLEEARAIARYYPGAGRAGLVALVERYGAWTKAEVALRAKALDALKAAEDGATGRPYAKSISAVERAQAVFAKIGDRICEYNAEVAKASIALNVEETAAAKTHFRAALEIARSHDDVSNEARLTASIGFVDVMLEDYVAATAELEDAYAKYQKAGLSSREPTIHRQLALLYESTGNLPKALFHNENAFMLSKSLCRDVDSAEQWQVLLGKGRLLRAMGQYGQAEALLRGGRAEAKEKADAGREMEALYELGLTYQESERHGDAIRVFEEMLAIGERISTPERKIFDIRYAWRDEARVLAQMGRSYLELRDYNKAFRQFRSGYDYYVNHKNQKGQAEMYAKLGTTFLKIGYFKDAIRKFENARELSERIGLGKLHAEIYGGLGAAYRGTGELEQALAYYEKADEARGRYALPLDEAERGKEDFRRFLNEYAEALFSLHDAHPDAGYDRRLFTLWDRGKSARFQATIAKAAARHALSPELRELADRESALSSKVASLRRQNDAAAGKEAAASEMSLSGQLEEQLIAAEASLKVQQDLLERRSGRYADLIRPKPLQVEELQAILRPGEVALSYLIGETRSAAFVVHRDRFRLVNLPIRRAELAQLVHAFRIGLDRVGIAGSEEPLLDVQDLEAFRPEVARELYMKLFAPVEAALQGTEERMIVAADDVLFTVPLEGLIDQEIDRTAFAAARDAGRHGARPYLAEYSVPHYLVQRFVISYLPSMSVLRSARLFPKPQSAKRSYRLVAFADPIFSQDAGSAYTAGTAGAPPLPRLKDTAEEANAIARLVGEEHAKVFAQEAATEENVYTFPLGQADILLFATHGLLGEPRLTSGEPALVLSQVNNPPGIDGLLTASEVLGLDLNAQVAVLSACSTYGRGDVAAHGEGFAGFARSFMYAGARALLVTHWPVDSPATRALVVATFRDSSVQIPVALSRAKRSIRQDTRELGPGSKRRMSLSHPLFWAGFVYVGD